MIFYMRGHKLSNLTTQTERNKERKVDIIRKETQNRNFCQILVPQNLSPGQPVMQYLYHFVKLIN